MLDIEKIRHLREQAGLTQLDAATKAGWTKANWSAVETGKRLNPTLDVLETIAKVLKCKVRDLVK